MRRFFSALVIVCASVAHAKPEKIGKLGFDLGEAWKCTLEGAEQFCVKDVTENPPKEMVVITSRDRTKDDTMAKFKTHLKEQRTFKGPDGAEFKSEIKYVKDAKVGGRSWIDSLHYQSEIPGYFTRYLATVDGKTAIVATFSAKKDIFDTMNAQIPKWAQAFTIQK